MIALAKNRALAAVIGLLVLCAAAGFGCNGKQVVRLGEVSNNAVRFTIETRAAPGALQELGVGLSNAIGEGFSLRPALERIAVSDEPYGEAIATAVCIGLGRVANYANQENVQPATPTTWERFLVDQVHVLLPGNPLSFVETKVKQVTATVNLARVSPQAAITYVRECALKGR